MRFVTIGGAALLAALAFAAEAAPLHVATEKVNRETENVIIEASYPHTGEAAIDDAIKAFVDKAISDLDDQAELDHAQAVEDNVDRTPPKYGLYLSFEVPRNDDQIFAVLFTQSLDTGGAHPNHFFRTFNFERSDGWQLFLPEIFDGPAALDRISQLATANLTEAIGGPDGMSDPDWIKTGAGPDWNNFGDFILMKDSLVLHFPPYQVAAYAAGPQETAIPLDELQGYMRQDWRTPVPAFDCAKAGTPTETAICSDVALARLDREMSRLYAQSQSFADDADKPALKAAQSAWLGDRNSCSGDVACLTEAYEQRIAALTPQN